MQEWQRCRLRMPYCVPATGLDRFWLGGLCLFSHPLSHILRLYDFTSYVKVKLTLFTPWKLTGTGGEGVELWLTHC